MYHNIKFRQGKIIALVDCNNFFASCESIFNPSLVGRPLVILSSNDGCAIARSNEAKELGIAMGAPLHTFKHLLITHNVQVLSSNFDLYADMSKRLFQVLQTFTPDIEIYSVDEAFLDLTPLGCDDYETLAGMMHHRVQQWLGIPITIGIAPTKTLAKIAAHYAKKQRQPFLLLNDRDLADVHMKKTPVVDVWGVGKALHQKLKIRGIYTAYDLKMCDPRWARQSMTVTGEKLVRELQGIACYPLHQHIDNPNSMQVTRSFGQTLLNLEDLEEAASTHASTMAQKLRAKNKLTSIIHVFCQTSRFHRDRYFQGIGMASFDSPTNDTAILIKGALHALRQAFKSGYAYKKVGIVAPCLHDVSAMVQTKLFTPTNDLSSGVQPPSQQNTTIGPALDLLNKKFGRQTVFFASNGINPKHQSRQQHKSPKYTTCFHDIPKVKA